MRTTRLSGNWLPWQQHHLVGISDHLEEDKLAR